MKAIKFLVLIAGIGFVGPSLSMPPDQTLYGEWNYITSKGVVTSAPWYFSDSGFGNTKRWFFMEGTCDFGSDKCIGKSDHEHNLAVCTFSLLPDGLLQRECEISKKNENGEFSGEKKSNVGTYKKSSSHTDSTKKTANELSQLLKYQNLSWKGGLTSEERRVAEQEGKTVGLPVGHQGRYGRWKSVNKNSDGSSWYFYKDGFGSSAETWFVNDANACNPPHATRCFDDLKSDRVNHKLICGSYYTSKQLILSCTAWERSEDESLSRIPRKLVYEFERVADLSGAELAKAISYSKRYKELLVERENKRKELAKKRAEEKTAADDRAYQENPAEALRKYYLIDYVEERQGAALMGMLSGTQATGNFLSDPFASGTLDGLVRAEADQYALSAIAGGMEKRMSEFLAIRSKNPDWGFDDVLYESGVNVKSIFYDESLAKAHNKDYHNVFRFLYEQKDGPSFLVNFKRDLQKRMANCMDEQKKLPPSKRVSKDPDGVVAYCKNSVISARDAEDSLIIRKSIDSPMENSIFEALMKED